MPRYLRKKYCDISISWYQYYLIISPSPECRCPDTMLSVSVLEAGLCCGAGAAAGVAEAAGRDGGADGEGGVAGRGGAHWRTTPAGGRAEPSRRRAAAALRSTPAQPTGRREGNTTRTHYFNHDVCAKSIGALEEYYVINKCCSVHG